MKSSHMMVWGKVSTGVLKHQAQFIRDRKATSSQMEDNNSPVRRRLSCFVSQDEQQWGRTLDVGKEKTEFHGGWFTKKTSHFLMIPRCVLLPPLQLESCTESLGFRFSVSLDFCFERCKKKPSVVLRPPAVTGVVLIWRTGWKVELLKGNFPKCNTLNCVYRSLEVTLHMWK